MTPTHRTLVVIATYNEIENLPRLVDELFAHAPDVDLLVIDDNSPDGTGEWCDQRLRSDQRMACLHRTGKLGLGTATVAGLQYAIDHNYEFVLTMDADFSHHPRYIPNLRARVEASDACCDIVIGSRYIADGGIQGWPTYRRWISRAINFYARALLGLPVRDCSGAFRCYRTATIAKLDLTHIRSRGYSYLEEILWLLHRQGARFCEVPITFVDRELGKTKINWREAAVALWLIFRLGLISRLGFAG